MHISVLFKFNFLVSYQTFPLYSHYLSHFYFDRPGLIFDFVYSIFKKNILKLSRLTDSCTALLHRLRNKKLSCRWQTARRICEICNGVADLLKTPLLLNFILCLLLKSILTDAKYFSKILFLKYISKIAVTYWRLFSVLCWHCIKCAFVLLLLFILFFLQRQYKESEHKIFLVTGSSYRHRVQWLSRSVSCHFSVLQATNNDRCYFLYASHVEQRIVVRQCVFLSHSSSEADLPAAWTWRCDQSCFCVRVE